MSEFADKSPIASQTSTPLTDMVNDVIETKTRMDDEMYWYMERKAHRFGPSEEEKGKLTKELGALDTATLLGEPYREYIKHITKFVRAGSVDLIAPHIDAIINRLPEASRYVAEHGQPKLIRAVEHPTNVFIQVYSLLELSLREEGLRIMPEQVKALYKLGRSEWPLLLKYAIFFDERNRPYGDSLDIESLFKTDITEDLLTSCDENFSYNNSLDYQLDHAKSANRRIISQIFIFALLKAEKPYQVRSVLGRIGVFMDLGEMRKVLRGYVNSNPGFRERYDEVCHYIGLDQGEETASDLTRDIYGRIEFSEYGPNQKMLDFEENLLKQEFSGRSDILDVGCGTGRLLTALDGQNGMHVTGFDASNRHIQQIKGKKPDADVFVASWHSIPIPGKVFDAVYCLGRSFTHNTTVMDAIESLSEMRRVMKNDGVLILDLPDSASGEHKELIERTLRIAFSRGLINLTPGLINDSPDSEHYFDRFAPTDEQFKGMAYLAGFDASVIAEKSYQGVSGKENKNKYWKLTKIHPDNFTKEQGKTAVDRAFRPAFSTEEIISALREWVSANSEDPLAKLKSKKKDH